MYENDITVEGTVHDVALGKTSTGKQQLAITFALAGDPTLPKFITLYRFFTPNAIPYTMEDLKTLGWDPEAHAWDLVDLMESQAIINRQVSLVLGPEEYEGKVRLKVKFVNASGAGAVKDRMNRDEALAFQAELRAGLGIHGVAASASRPAPTKWEQPVTRGANDDDPFAEEPPI